MQLAFAKGVYFCIEQPPDFLSVFWPKEVPSTIANLHAVLGFFDARNTAERPVLYLFPGPLLICHSMGT